MYLRSNAFGPSSSISQFSPACDPEMVTRQSPRFSLSACSTLAVIFLRQLSISNILQFDHYSHLSAILPKLPVPLCKPVKPRLDGFVTDS